MLSLSTKKKTNNYQPFSVSPTCSKLFAKVIFDTIFQHLTVSKIIQISLISCLTILVYIKYMKYMLLLMLIPHYRLEAFFQIYVMLLIEYDMKVYIYILWKLTNNLELNVNLFPDDTSMFSIVSDPINTSQKLNKDLDEVSLWLNKWKISRSF